MNRTPEMIYLTAKDQPKYEKRISLAYYLSFTCQGLSAGIFGPAMVWFASRTNSTVAEITPVLIFYNIGFILSSLLISNLFDRKPGNRLMAGSLCIMIGVMPGFCFVSNRLQLFLLAAVMGMALSVIDNGGNVLFPWLLHDRAGRPLNLVHLFYSAGCTITPFLIGLALKKWNQVTPVFLLLAVLVIFPGMLLFRLPSPRQQQDNTNAVSPGSSSNTGLQQILTAAGTYGLLLFLFSSCQSTFNNWTSTVLLRSGLADESAAAMMSSLFWAGTFSGRMLAAWLVEKRRPDQIVLSCLIIAVTNGIVMFFGRGSLLLTGICVFINGSATGPILANVFSIMKGHGLVSAKINGIVQACSQLGGMILPSLFGRIFGDSAASYTPFVIITLAASMAELIVLCLILRRDPVR